MSPPVENRTIAEIIDLPKLEKSLRSVRSLHSAVMSVIILRSQRAGHGPARLSAVDASPRGHNPGRLVAVHEIASCRRNGRGRYRQRFPGHLARGGPGHPHQCADWHPGSRLPRRVRPGHENGGGGPFLRKILTGLPSILAGVFAYSVVVLATGTFSAPAAGVALALLMLPTVLLTAEEAIRMVPTRMREAAIGMGATPTQMVLRVTLPTAMPGILTGVMLAIARAAGETAPLLFTALFSDYWLTANVMEPTPSLAVLIYDFSGSPYPNQIKIAWAASLVLVFLVLLLNLGGRALAKRDFRS